LFDMELELWLIAWGLSQGTKSPYHFISNFNA
jgi:hypothetical protein